VHISELAQGRVNKTTDVVNMGDAVKVKVLGFDERGKVKLSMRVVDQATGEDISDKVGPKGGGGRDRGDRGGHGGHGGRDNGTETQPGQGEQPAAPSSASAAAVD
jgi:transcriptional accessory protein Tex/SPT6